MLLIFVSRPTQSGCKFLVFSVTSFTSSASSTSFPCLSGQFLTAHFLYHALKSRGLPIRTIS